MKLALAFALPLALAALATGCSKPSPEEQKKQEDQLAAALASAMAMPSAAATVNAATAPAAANPGGIGATCNNATDGKYKKGATPCPHDNLLGSCARADQGSGLNDIDYFYKQPGTTADSMKGLCESVMSGKWTDAPKSAAPAAPAKGAPKGKK
jgi:hypothetical protein